MNDLHHRLATAELAGARFRLADDGTIRVIAGNAGSDLLAELRQHRDVVAAILRGREAKYAQMARPPPERPRAPDALRDGLLAGYATHALDPSNARG